MLIYARNAAYLRNENESQCMLCRAIPSTLSFEFLRAFHDRPKVEAVSVHLHHYPITTTDGTLRNAVEWFYDWRRLDDIGWGYSGRFSSASLLLQEFRNQRSFY